MLNFADIIARATVYRARVGWRREFKSEAEALQYERGYLAWPEPPALECFGTPESTGFFDAEEDQQQRDDRSDE